MQFKVSFGGYLTHQMGPLFWVGFRLTACRVWLSLSCLLLYRSPTLPPLMLITLLYVPILFTSLLFGSSPPPFSRCNNSLGQMSTRHTQTNTLPDLPQTHCYSGGDHCYSNLLAVACESRPILAGLGDRCVVGSAAHTIILCCGPGPGCGCEATPPT